VNWDPKFLTAISDLEVESREGEGLAMASRNPLEGEPGRFLVVATTRPETMLGDTAVAVHPEDARFRDLVRQAVVLPLVGRAIPVVADEHSDPEKGWGAVKITPEHVFQTISRWASAWPRHMPSVLDAEGRVMLEEISAAFAEAEGRVRPRLPARLGGRTASRPRKAIVARLEEMGLVEKTERTPMPCRMATAPACRSSRA